MATYYIPSENPSLTNTGYMRLVLNCTQQRATNSTICAMALQIKTVGNNSRYTLVGTITIDGETITPTANGNYAVSGQWVTIWNGEKEVKHSSSGQKTVRVTTAGAYAVGVEWERLTAYTINPGATGPLSPRYIYQYIPSANYDYTLTPIAWRYTLTSSAAQHATLIVARQKTNETSAALGNLSNGAYLYYGDKLKITYGATTGFKQSCTVDGSAITANPYTLTVVNNVSVAASADPMATVHMSNGEGFDSYLIYVSDGESWNLHQGYMSDGESWVNCY